MVLTLAMTVVALSSLVFYYIYKVSVLQESLKSKDSCLEYREKDVRSYLDERNEVIHQRTELLWFIRRMMQGQIDSGKNLVEFRYSEDGLKLINQALERLHGPSLLRIVANECEMVDGVKYFKKVRVEVC